MHREILDFFKATKEKHPELFAAGKILEAGSLDINGSPREYFSDECNYIGVDSKQGAGVDWWGIFHEYEEEPDFSFDVCVTTEMLEHDPFWVLSLRHMVKKLKMGGSLIISCAGPARGPHGVQFYRSPDGTATKSEYHPWGPEKDYYWNIKPELLFYELFSICSFKSVEFTMERGGQDLFLIARGLFDMKPNYHGRNQVALLKKHGRTAIDSY